MKVKVSVAQSSPTLSDSMDCGLWGSSVHEILQARIPEWVAIPFSRGSSQPRVWTWVSCVAGRFFTIWAPGTLRVDDKTSKILYRYHFERLVKKPLGHALFPLVKYFYNYTAQCRRLSSFSAYCNRAATTVGISQNSTEDAVCVLKLFTHRYIYYFANENS